MFPLIQAIAYDELSTNVTDMWSKAGVRVDVTSGSWGRCGTGGSAELSVLCRAPILSRAFGMLTARAMFRVDAMPLVEPMKAML